MPQERDADDDDAFERGADDDDDFDAFERGADDDDDMWERYAFQLSNFLL